MRGLRAGLSKTAQIVGVRWLIEQVLAMNDQSAPRADVQKNQTYTAMSPKTIRKRRTHRPMNGSVQESNGINSPVLATTGR
jgi:hypothetical protein